MTARRLAGKNIPLFFPEEVRRSLLVEQKVGDYLLELLVFVLELTHFARPAPGDPLVFATPPVKRGLRDSQLATYLHGGRSGRDLPECLHDLVFGEFAWSHRSILHPHALKNLKIRRALVPRPADLR
jgi:hypothetical protein